MDWYELEGGLGFWVEEIPERKKERKKERILMERMRTKNDSTECRGISTYKNQKGLEYEGSKARGENSYVVEKESNI